jgi:hypothetical protein
MRDAGLWPGDVIVTMDDARIDTVEDLLPSCASASRVPRCG